METWLTADKTLLLPAAYGNMVDSWQNSIAANNLLNWDDSWKKNSVAASKLL